MTYSVSRPYRASEIFTLQDTPTAEGKPSFASLKAVRRPEWKGTPEEFKGPGIYGLFCQGKLFYVGLFAGSSKNAFGSSVLTRWFKHLTFQTLRSPEITFVASNLNKLKNLGGPAAEAFAELTGGLNNDVSQWTSEHTPLIGKAGHGASCTFHKGRFAVKNWAVFAPGNEERMLSDISFIYVQIKQDSTHLLGNSKGSERAAWVKKKWLKTREAALINDLAPICNSESIEYREDVGVDEFLASVRSQFNTPLAQFEVGDAEFHREIIKLADDIVDEQEAIETESDTSEIRLRRKLSDQGEALIDDLYENHPPGLTIGCTNTPDFRIWFQPAKGTQRRVLMILIPRADGKIRCEVTASVATCQVAGFDARRSADNTKSQFEFDPAELHASSLFLLIGAAVQQIAQ